MWTMKFFFLVSIVFQWTNGFELFVRESSGQNQSLLNLNSFKNRSYQIPLFQTRTIVVDIKSDEVFLASGKNFSAFRLQVKSKDSQAIEIKKESTAVSTSFSSIELDSILFDDLFIAPKTDGLDQIFNAFSWPKLIAMNQNQIHPIVWTIRTTKMKQTDVIITLDVFFNDGSKVSSSNSFKLLVIQPKRVIDQIFFALLPILIIFISVQMGILLDTKVLIELVRKPKAVCIGFIAQYGLMPFLAVAIAKIFRFSTLNSLALFVIGCCPGSGASNQWTLLFDGDVNLSAVMSFVSTAASFVMLPLYFYTLGTIYTDELSIRVPFLGLVRSLALVVFPYSLGILISHWSSKIRALVERLVKPMMLFLLIFFLVFGTIVNWYMFLMIDLHTALTAPLLPYLGFILGALIAWVFRLPWTHVKTIGIEAGIQNIGIAFMIIRYSFPQPYATTALIVPLIVSYLTTKPFWLIYVVRNRWKRYEKEKETKNVSNPCAPTVKSDGTSNENENEKNQDLVEMMQNL